MKTSIITASGATHSGQARDLNEDAFEIHIETTAFVLCDGVGGNQAGEVANQLGCSTAIA